MRLAVFSCPATSHPAIPASGLLPVLLETRPETACGGEKWSPAGLTTGSKESKKYHKPGIPSQVGSWKCQSKYLCCKEIGRKLTCVIKVYTWSFVFLLYCQLLFWHQTSTLFNSQKPKKKHLLFSWNAKVEETGQHRNVSRIASPIGDGPHNGTRGSEPFLSRWRLGFLQHWFAEDLSLSHLKTCLSTIIDWWRLFETPVQARDNIRIEVLGTSIIASTNPLLQRFFLVRCGRFYVSTINSDRKDS